LLLAVTLKMTGRIASRNTWGDGPGCLVAVDPGGHLDDALHPGAAQGLEAGERLLGIGQVAQALGQHHGVLDGQRGPLPGGRGGSVGGVADDDLMT
jgi:hypothetical protein